MKTSLKIKQFLIVALTVLLCSSCLDSDNAFQIGVNRAFVIQENVMDGDELIQKKFFPYILFSGNEDFSTYECKTTSGVTVPVKRYFDYKYAAEIDLSRSTYTTSLPNDSYILSATNADGELAKTQIDLTITASLGAFNNFEASCADGKYKAKWDAVENATSYVVIITENSSMSPIFLAYHENFSGRDIEVSLSSMSGYSDLKTGTTYRIYILAQNSALCLYSDYVQFTME